MNFYRRAGTPEQAHCIIPIRVITNVFSFTRMEQEVFGRLPTELRSTNEIVWKNLLQTYLFWHFRL